MRSAFIGGPGDDASEALSDPAGQQQRCGRLAHPPFDLGGVIFLGGTVRRKCGECIRPVGRRLPGKRRLEQALGMRVILNGQPEVAGNRRISSALSAAALGSTAAGPDRASPRSSGNVSKSPAVIANGPIHGPIPYDGALMSIGLATSRSQSLCI